ncbi:Holliday junction resolvase RuvX [Candidatus Uhrbacteria bacterium]|nr:Holliday junction resolvase RuvX [Candidatus Uhrbacteria bacterium]
MRVLGIDYGARRVGIALGDTATGIASPWDVVSGADRLELLRRLHETIALEGVDAVVVGVPRPLRDRTRETAQAKEIRAFIEDLRAQGVTVEEADESLTSKLAQVQMRERGEKGKRDDLAAAAILQGWLDGREGSL